jgi:hypothetical protein
MANDDDVSTPQRINAHASAFARIPLWWILTLRACGAPPATRDVLVVIASYADKKTGEAWPSVSTIAATLGIQKNAVLVAIRELKAAGILTSTPRNRRSRETNLYRLAFQVSTSDTGTQVSAADTKWASPAVSGIQIGADQVSTSDTGTQVSAADTKWASPAVSGIQIGADQVSEADSDQVPDLCSNGVRNLPVEPTKEPSYPSLRSGSASAAASAADALHSTSNKGADDLDCAIRLLQRRSNDVSERRMRELRAAGGVA